jgi:transcription-repair coupling factor (superfamily II helicase)
MAWDVLSDNWLKQKTFFFDLATVNKYKLSGVVGSALSFLSASLFNKYQAHFLLVAEDREKAAYLADDLSHLIDPSQVHYFPAAYKKPFDNYRNEQAEVDNANQLLRTEVLNLLNNNKTQQHFIISYPEAIFEKVITKQNLQQNSLNIHVNEKLTIDFLQEFFATYHYEYTDFVYEPGQYAIRGGIVDIFSYSNNEPYRIELFGDDVESIRTFDPNTQLSLKNFDFATIVPNLSGGITHIIRQSLFEFLGTKTIVIAENAATIREKLDVYYKKAHDAYCNYEGETKLTEPYELFLDGASFISALENLNTIEFGNATLFEANLISFHQSPQPSFNKNFEIFFKHLLENVAKGYKNYLLTDTEKQVERIDAILASIYTQHYKGAEMQDLMIQPIFLSQSEGFIDHEFKEAYFTDHQLFDRYHKYKVKTTGFKKTEAITLKEFQNLNPGDFIVHIDHGIGRFAGLEKMVANGKEQESIRILYKDNDVLYVSIHALHKISKYSGKDGTAPRIDKLGSTTWTTLKNKTKKKVKEVAYDLIKLYAKRKTSPGHAFAQDGYMQHELEASFIYEDTPDQIKVTHDVKQDMQRSYPMDRLVCGDVGFGKTEIAVRAAFKAATDGKQVAILVPTTILALQHYKTFSDRLKDMPIKVDYVNRYRSAKDQKATLENLKEGRVDIIIGTHKLAGKEVKFKDLGLLIIDEEQKFGVGIKDKLKTLKANVDTLTLTATPIPRTLQFSLMGARDLSVITTPPPNRFPVQTELISFNEEQIRDAIIFEMQRNGQVFFIHNKVNSIKEISGMIQRLVPEARICVGHGQLDGQELEEVMLGFVEGEYDILVATTIIESGLDIPNANTIIINDAQNFGLSDLHQMRGRVGRSNKKAFCYLMTPTFLTLTTDAKKRLKAIEEFSDLGSGFHISMRDLDIRGAGNLLGGEQSGFINDMGFDTYMKILNEAIHELKQEDWYQDEYAHLYEDNQKSNKTFAGKYIQDAQIDTDLEIMIPDTYVNHTSERLVLYRELDDSQTEEDLDRFSEKMIDRFGPLPQQVLELMDTVRLRWLCVEIGFEKVTLKNGILIGYFLSKQDSDYFSSAIFRTIMLFVQKNPHGCKLKETGTKLALIVQRIDTVKSAIAFLSKIKTTIEHEQTEKV